MLSFQWEICFEAREFKHVVEKISVCMRVVVVWTQASAKITGPIFFQLRKPLYLGQNRYEIFLEKFP